MVAAVAGHTILAADNAFVTLYKMGLLPESDHRQGIPLSPTFQTIYSMDQTGMSGAVNHGLT
jgi:hypothetical protein